MSVFDQFFIKGHLYKPKSASAIERSSQSRRSFEALAIAKDISQ
jgi:hypothetical protein